jgi:hypothetical protein
VSSTDRSLLGPLQLTLALPLRGRHSRSGFATKNTASDMGVTHTMYALDLNALTVVSRGPRPHAAYRLLQLSFLRAHLRTFQTSPYVAMANHRASKWTYDLRRTSNRVFTGQGLHHYGDNVSPHHGNRSPRWIYPNLIDPGTTCHWLMPNVIWKGSRSAVVR